MEKDKKMSIQEFFQTVDRLEEKEFYRFHFRGREYFLFPSDYFRDVSVKTPPGIWKNITFDYRDNQGEVVTLATMRADEHTRLIQDVQTLKREERKIEEFKKSSKSQDVLLFFVLLLTTVLCAKVL